MMCTVVKPGTLTVLMGASGTAMFIHSGIKRWSSHCSGKTTCPDVLAQQKNIGIVSGDVLVKGQPLNSDFAQGMAYGVLLFGFLACLSYVLRTQWNKWMIHEGGFCLRLDHLLHADDIWHA